MNVANIMPGDRIEVELRYTELLVPTDGIYELVYPTVVGPRYASETPTSTAASNKFVQRAVPAGGRRRRPYAFDINGHARRRACRSRSSTRRRTRSRPRSTANTTRPSRSTQTARRPATSDFILRYRLAGDEIESGLLLFPGANENFFLLMVQPPRRAALEQIPPREYVFVLDVSGSMHGFPLDTAKALMRDLLGDLRPTDTLQRAAVLGRLEPARRRRPSTPTRTTSTTRSRSSIASNGGGGTELMPALERAMTLPRVAKDVSRSVRRRHRRLHRRGDRVFEHVRKHLGEANVFAFGIGSSVNRHLIEGMARAGQGEPFVVLDHDAGRPSGRRSSARTSSRRCSRRCKVAFDGLRDLRRRAAGAARRVRGSPAGGVRQVQGHAERQDHAHRRVGPRPLRQHDRR